MSAVTNLDLMAQRAESARLLTARIYRYCELFDSGQFDTFAAQFERGSWHRAGFGTEAVRRWIDDYVITYDGSPRTQHSTTNLVLEIAADDQSASATSYVTVSQAAPDLPLQMIFAGRYLDRFERVDGAWAWIERSIESRLRGDTSHHVRPH